MDITAYRPKEREKSPAAGSGKEVSDASQTQQLSAQAPGPALVSPDSQNASVIGVLRLLPLRQDKTDVSYELLIRNKPAYFIQGPRAMLDDFARYTVTIDGTLNADLEKQFLRPVLTVTRIQLVL